MTDKKHTEGPWIAAPYSSVVGAPVASASGRPVASVTYFNLGDGFENHDNESAANARLIAAAPELMEALIMVRDADDDCKKDGLPSMPTPARAKIDAAIAKAEGRS